MRVHRPHESALSKEIAFVTSHDNARPALWYFIDAGWLKRWKMYAQRRGDNPGPISNAQLLDPEFRFRKPKIGLRAGAHYRGVCAEVWQYLQMRYGGGPAIVGLSLDLTTATIELPDDTLCREDTMRTDSRSSPVPDRMRRDPSSNTVGTGSSTRSGRSHQTMSRATTSASMTASVPPATPTTPKTPKTPLDESKAGTLKPSGSQGAAEQERAPGFGGVMGTLLRSLSLRASGSSSARKRSNSKPKQRLSATSDSAADAKDAQQEVNSGDKEPEMEMEMGAADSELVVSPRRNKHRMEVAAAKAKEVEAMKLQESKDLAFQKEIQQWEDVGHNALMSLARVA